MTANTEWLDARDTNVAYVEHIDDHGTESNGPALLLTMDDIVAIEGSRDDLIQLGLRIVQALTLEEQNERQT